MTNVETIVDLWCGKEYVGTVGFIPAVGERVDIAISNKYGEDIEQRAYEVVSRVWYARLNRDNGRSAARQTLRLNVVPVVEQTMVPGVRGGS